LNLRKLKRGKKRSRLAVSEIIGAILMLGATIIIGLVTWLYVAQAAQRNEVGLNNSASENFRVANANFSSSNLVTLDIYNVQSSSAYVISILVTNGSCSHCWTSYTPVLTWTNGTNAAKSTGPNCKNCVPITGQAVTLVNVNVGSYSFIPSNYPKNFTYTFKVIGEYGLDAQYQQVR
jgi:hypothetical protein